MLQHDRPSLSVGRLTVDIPSRYRRVRAEQLLDVAPPGHPRDICLRRGCRQTDGQLGHLDIDGTPAFGKAASRDTTCDEPTTVESTERVTRAGVSPAGTPRCVGANGASDLRWIASSGIAAPIGT